MADDHKHWKGSKVPFEIRGFFDGYIARSHYHTAAYNLGEFIERYSVHEDILKKAKEAMESCHSRFSPMYPFHPEYMNSYHEGILEADRLARARQKYPGMGTSPILWEGE